MHLENGATLDADFVVSATGVRANMDFLDGSGIATDQGILVNPAMQTNIPNIYVAGDVAQGLDFSTGQYSVQAIQPTASEHAQIAEKYAGFQTSPASKLYQHDRSHSDITGTFTLDCMDAGGRATQGAVAEYLAITPRRRLSATLAFVKSHFSRSIVKDERVSDSRLRKKERGLWQRRYWEHQIPDDRGFQRYMDYIHYNPVKHRLVTKVKELPAGHKGLIHPLIVGFN